MRNVDSRQVALGGGQTLVEEDPRDRRACSRGPRVLLGPRGQTHDGPRADARRGLARDRSPDLVARPTFGRLSRPSTPRPATTSDASCSSTRPTATRSPRRRFIQFSFLLLLVAPTLSAGYWGLVIGFLLVGFFLGLLWLVTLLTARVTRAHAYPARLEVDESGVSIQQPTSSAHLEWRFVSRVRKSGPYFILSRSLVAVPIPRRSFGEPGSEETFRALCRAHTRTNF
jgi:hypothetical protein